MQYLIEFPVHLAIPSYQPVPESIIPCQNNEDFSSKRFLDSTGMTLLQEFSTINHSSSTIVHSYRETPYFKNSLFMLPQTS